MPPGHPSDGVGQTGRVPTTDRPARRVIRDVEPSAVADLVEDAPRAHLAFVEGNRAEVVPVVTRRVAGQQLVAVPGGARGLDGREVHLVRDDGQYWFELRALAVRGVLRAIPAPDGSGRAGADPLPWFRLEPGRTVAWDYGQLREADDE